VEFYSVLRFNDSSVTKIMGVKKLYKEKNC